MEFQFAIQTMSIDNKQKIKMHPIENKKDMHLNVCWGSDLTPGVLMKVNDVLPNHHWILLHRWYSSLKAVIKWNGNYSSSFTITRGTRQGSLLSPYLFNVFIDSLLRQLQQTNYGLRLGDSCYQSIAYADDITVFSPTATGLQSLIDICHRYACQWRFSFGLKKTKCMTAGKHILDSQTTWLLGDRPIDNVDNLEVLGVVLDNVGSCLPHTNKRIQKSRQSYFGLVPLGLNYPGLQSNVKAYIWNLVCRPTLLYGLESIHLDPASIRQLESLQGSLVKRMNGISKRSHHNNLLLALGIPRVVEGVTDRVLSLYYQIFNVDSPMRNLCTYMLGQYTLSGQYVKNTLCNLYYDK